MNYIVGGCLAVLSIEDIRKQKVPVWSLVILLFSSIMYEALQQVSIIEAVLGAFPGILMMVLALLLPQSLGIGDGMLSVCYGLLYGWRRTCIWLMVSFLLAAVFGLFLKLFTKRRHISIPFIPFLALVHMGMNL